MRVSTQTKDWLLQSDIPYIRYNAALIFDLNQANHNDLLKDPFIQENIQALQKWGEELKRHDKADLQIHRLALLADLGVKAGDPPLKKILEQILKSFNERSIPEVSINIPPRFGGTGKPQSAWILCDYPTILYALIKMGVEIPLIKQSVQTLIELVDKDGYHCVGSLPKFRGPGPKTSICPYVNLIAVKALGNHSLGKTSEAAQIGIDALLYHWKVQKEKKFFLFGIGTDFKKLKFPFVWYNILHMLYAFSPYENIHQRPEVKEMIDLVLAKSNSELQFTPESMYRAYQDQDFSNKKTPSPTLTLFVLKTLMQMGIIET